jgi:large-conductance mechanosensitive channel
MGNHKRIMVRIPSKEEKMIENDYNKIITQIIDSLNKGTIKKSILIKIIQSITRREEFIKQTKKEQEKEYKETEEEIKKFLNKKGIPNG